MAFLILFERIVYFIIVVLQFAMFVRAILSWFPLDPDGKVANFLYFITEPVIVPVRMLLGRFEFVQNFPMDIPFFVTFVLLSVVSSFLL